MSTCFILNGGSPVEVPSGLTIVAGVYCTDVRCVNRFHLKGDSPVEVPNGLTIIVGIYGTEVYNVNFFHFVGRFASRSCPPIIKDGFIERNA